MAKKLTVRRSSLATSKIPPIEFKLSYTTAAALDHLICAQYVHARKIAEQGNDSLLESLEVIEKFANALSQYLEKYQQFCYIYSMKNITLKKLFIPVLVLLLAVIGFSILTSCGDKITYVNVPTTTVYDSVLDTTTTTTSTTTTVYYSKTDQFLDEVRTSVPMGSFYVSDADLTKFANLVCDVLRKGGTGATIASTIVESFTDSDDIRFFSRIAGIGVRYFCPDLSYRVTMSV